MFIGFFPEVSTIIKKNPMHYIALHIHERKKLCDNKKLPV